MSVRVRDNGYNRVLEAIQTVDGKVEAGVLGQQAGAQHPRSKLTVGELAAVHEFGLGHTPERSFVRAFVDDDARELMPQIAELVRLRSLGILSKEEFRTVVGALLSEGMKKRMDEGIPPPLLPQTVNRKDGPPVPLEDTMTLRDAISYRWSSK